jgi:outer membrane receptor protein involved in Fe transport
MLKRIPGFAFTSLVQTSAVEASEQNVEIRGLRGRYSQVLINGKRIAGDNQYNTINYDTIPADIIQQVQVIRGSTAEYDSQGAGLTINIILKDGATIEQDQTTNWRVSGQSSDGRSGGTVSLSTAGELNQSFYSINLTHSDRDSRAQSSGSSVLNEETEYFGEVTSNSLSTKSTAFTELSEKSSGLTGTFNTSLGDGDLRLVSTIIQRKAADSGFGEVEVRSVYSSDYYSYDRNIEEAIRVESAVEELRYGINAEYLTSFDDDNFSLFLGYDKASAENTGLLNELGAQSSFDTVRDEIRFNIKYEMFLTEAQQLVLGADFETSSSDRDSFIPQHESFGGDTRSRQQEYVDSNEDGLDFYLSYSIALTDSLSLKLGTRYESIKYQLSSSYEVPDATPDFYNPDDDVSLITGTDGDFKSKQSANNPSLNLAWKISEEHQLRFSASRNVNLPSLDDLSPVSFPERSSEPLRFGQLNARIGSPDLRPSKVNGFDVSYDFSFAGNGMIGLSVFERRVKDNIEYLEVNILDNQRTTLLANLVPNYAELETHFGGSQITRVEKPFNRKNPFKTRGVELDFSIPMQLLGLPTMNFISNISYAERVQTGLTTIDRVSGNLTIDHLIESLGFSYGFSYNYTSDDKTAVLDDDEFEIGFDTIKRDPALDFFLQQRLSEDLVLKFNVENVLDSEEVATTEIDSSVKQENTIEFSESDPIYSLTLRGSF